MIKFYDTNALLTLLDDAFTEKFIISSKTLEEIEHIKVSANKDEEVKFKARILAKLIDEYQDDVEVIHCNGKINSILDNFELEKSPDNIIMATAFEKNKVTPVIFISNDINCKILARNIFGLNVESVKREEKLLYKGFKSVSLTERELAKFYENLRTNIYECKTNEYIILKDESDIVQDVRRWTGEIYETVFNKNVQSNILGIKLKPKDEFQKMAIDSMYNNMVTFISGKAGSGKSLLALTTALSLIESKKYRRLVVMFNPMASKGSQALGFYKGDLVDKAKQSNIGQILNSKFGDTNIIDSLILQDKLKLLPMSDARGVEIRDDEVLWISEAQNTTIDIMKLCLQRVSKNAKAFIEGDFNAQVDSYLYEDKNNGMKRAIEILQGESIFGYVEMQNTHRSKLAELADRM